MVCYFPVNVIQKDGQKPVYSAQGQQNFQNGFDGTELKIPCGRCIGCRLNRSQCWAVRITHEASLYDRNCFITLTYDEEHLPQDGSLVKKHFQDFMKRLRKRFVPVVPKNLTSSEADVFREKTQIRYFMCGEYGDALSRPHYHAILFNLDFFFDKDLSLISSRMSGNLYNSPILAKLWGKGMVTVGAVTLESAAYVARYCTKKISGNDAFEHYQGRQPEYATMSRRPGIGYRWYKKFKKDLYPSDFLNYNQSKIKPPRYYDNLFRNEFPEVFASLLEKRKARSLQKKDEFKFSRLQVKNTIGKLRFKEFKRNLETQR